MMLCHTLMLAVFSTSKSSIALTVTVCASPQLPLLNVSVDGDTLI